jgi:hypothetical protein
MISLEGNSSGMGTGLDNVLWAFRWTNSIWLLGGKVSHGGIFEIPFPH